MQSTTISGTAENADHTINPAKPNCIYQPILSPRTIRILRLEPGQEDDPIQCSLIHVDLDTSPVFEAVSYVWGDATDKLRITCNDRRIKITRNLFHALTMFRYPDRTRDLWADALCINQFNLKERSSQVQLMSRIYSGAKAVLVWLGHEQPDVVQAALKYICRVANHFNDGQLVEGNDFRDVISDRIATFSWKGRTICTPNDNPPSEIDETTANAFLRLGLCEFFQRGWVIQEVALTSTAIVHWGHAQIDFVWLGLAARLFIERVNGIQKISIKAYVGVYALSCIYDIYVDQGWPGWPLHFYLNLTRKALFSDPLDRIYGLLGLRTFDCDPLNGDTFIKADYGNTKLQCYRAFAEEYLFQRRDLEILCSVQHASNLHEGWLSWVPDWTVDVSNLLRASAWKSSGDEQATIMKETRSGRGCVSVRGVVVDVVNRVVHGGTTSKLRPARRIHDSLHELRYRFQAECIAWTVTGGWSPSSGRPVVNPSSLDTAQQLDAYEKFLDWDPATTPSSYPAHSDYLCMSMGRRLFITRDGMLGLGPRVMQTGDVVVVLFGSVPFVLRPVGDLWRLVGECYVHDIMHGEAIEKWKESGEPATDFCIY